MQVIEDRNRSKPILWLTAMVFLVLLALAACSGERDTSVMEAADTSVDDVRQEAEDLGETIADFGADQRQAAQREIDAAIDSLERRYEVIEARVESDWNELDQATRSEARATLDALAEGKTRLSETYADVADGGEDAWMQVKDGFADAYAAIDDAFSDAEREFGADS